MLVDLMWVLLQYLVALVNEGIWHEPPFSIFQIPGAQFYPITSEGACYTNCAAVNINPKTVGTVSIVEFNLATQSCMCKTTAELAYTNFVVSTRWNANLVGTCATYKQSKSALSGPVEIYWLTHAVCQLQVLVRMWWLHLLAALVSLTVSPNFWLHWITDDEHYLLIGIDGSNCV